MAAELKEGLAGLADVEDADAVGVLRECCEEVCVVGRCYASLESRK